MRRRAAISAPIVSAASRYTRIAAEAPIRELRVVEALGHARVLIAGHRPHRHGGQGQWVASVLYSGAAVTAGAPALPFGRLKRR
jgi:hypothetical protein